MPPHRRSGTGVIALVTVVVGLLAAVGLVFLVFGDSFDEIQQALSPIGASGPGGTADLGHGVSVTVPDGWDIEERDSDSVSSTSIRRGLSSVLGIVLIDKRQPPAELCDAHLRSMARTGITNATFTDARSVKTSGGAIAVQCEVTGTATGAFGSGPIALRYVVARADDRITAVLSLRYAPGSTKNETLQDYAAMVDSMWESMLD
jgi:hypothetical protein